MKIKKAITVSIRIPKRDTQEITLIERKQLADFFMALFDLEQNQNVIKGDVYAKPNR